MSKEIKNTVIEHHLTTGQVKELLGEPDNSYPAEASQRYVKSLASQPVDPQLATRMWSYRLGGCGLYLWRNQYLLTIVFDLNDKAYFCGIDLYSE